MAGLVVFANVHTVSESNGKFIYYNPGGGTGPCFETEERVEELIYLQITCVG